MTKTASTLPSRLNRPLRLSRAGLLAERVARAFWPLWSLAILALALLMLGVQDMIPLEAAWALGLGFALAGGAAPSSIFATALPVPTGTVDFVATTVYPDNDGASSRTAENT